MLELRHLQKNRTTIEADFYPEGLTVAGHIAVDTESGKIISKENPVGYTDSISDSAHVRQALLKLAKQNTLPEKYKIVWY